ncbi:FecR family protein [Algoriphagus pacificus]|uniref:FecR domain-containing protein n=1 Tax=Algoriphagus pacificus TaxID=2811234 RepID=A0ABS3CGQ6_9BACT|nr:FecR family protein [Algoriphagus pacificus]MBN7816289.1 FecR domain-containing protein [Algoriphagus pacificus]
MRFNPKSEYDFLKNEQFVLWVNNSGEIGHQYWDNWLKNNPEKEEFFNKAKSIIHSFQYAGDEKIDQNRLNDILVNIKSGQGSAKIFDFENEEIEPTRRLVNTRRIAAATILFFLAFGALTWNYFNSQTNKEDWVAVSTEKGERRLVQLPDGSSVTLDSYSSLKYLTDFEEGRKVILEGRAFFDIKKMEGKTFEVSSKALSVKVLGTSFDMNTDQNRGNGHVALVTGLVNVKAKDGKTLDLVPDQAAFLNFENEQLSKGEFDKDQILGWRENVLKFKDEPYGVVFERISNWYGVEFIYEDSLDLKGLYSATYHDQKLDDVLLGLSYASDLKFQIKSDSIYVSN